ncbi:MAG: hypothetical protein JO220_17275 [Hyphomicrobiales bacterium]|nr:hypothetical protein [Hyphomicrobiales bacterium]
MFSSEALIPKHEIGRVLFLPKIMGARQNVVNGDEMGITHRLNILRMTLGRPALI